jgi:hypothetical protein
MSVQAEFPFNTFQAVAQGEAYTKGAGSQAAIAVRPVVNHRSRSHCSLVYLALRACRLAVCLCVYAPCTALRVCTHCTALLPCGTPCQALLLCVCSSCCLAGVIWFCWSDGMVTPFGVVDANGVPKPSYASYQQYAHSAAAVGL